MSLFTGFLWNVPVLPLPQHHYPHLSPHCWHLFCDPQSMELTLLRSGLTNSWQWFPLGQRLYQASLAGLEVGGGTQFSEFIQLDFPASSRVPSPFSPRASVEVQGHFLTKLLGWSYFETRSEVEKV